MKRKVATRKLKRTCDYCKCSFSKGNIYYVKRKVLLVSNKPELVAYEITSCAKCNYKNKQHEKRFKKFKEKCHHPLTELVWSTIPGEIIMQPDHIECEICGKWV